MMLRTLLSILALVALSATGCGVGSAVCGTGSACIQGKSGPVCETLCAPDAGPACPSGQTCQAKSGCCSGTGCTAILQFVCCPADGC